MRMRNIDINDWRGAAIVNTGAGDIPKAASYPMSKKMRKFILKIGLPDNDHGRVVRVVGRSNFEAGFNALQMGLVPDGYVAHSLVEVRGEV